MSKTKSSNTAKPAKSAKPAKTANVTTAPTAKVEATATVSTTPMSTRKGMRYVKLSQSEKLSIIASRKRRGDNQVMATRFGMDTKAISAIVTGRKPNKKVVNSMYNQVRGRKVTAKVGA